MDLLYCTLVVEYRREKLKYPPQLPTFPTLNTFAVVCKEEKKRNEALDMLLPVTTFLFFYFFKQLNTNKLSSLSCQTQPQLRVSKTTPPPLLSHVHTAD